MAIDWRGIDWRSRKTWHTIGYVGSAAWMLLVLAVTEGAARHPLFNFIFVVPLAGWIIGIAVARLLRRGKPPDR